MNRPLSASKFAEFVAVFLLGLCSAICEADDRRIEMLRRFDRNKDGSVSPDEIPSAARPIVRRLAEQAGIGVSQSISIESVKKAISGGGTAADSGERSSSSTRKKTSGRDAAPKTAGFSNPTEHKKVPGFDVPVGYVPPEEKYSSSVIRYVARIMERYDRDRNGILDPEEMKRVEWQSDPKQSDLNRDGQISTVEMYERITKRWARDQGRGDDNRSSSKPSSTSDSKKSSDSSSRIREYAQSLLRRYDKNKNGVIDKDEWGSMRGDPAKDDLNKDGHLTLDELIVRLNNYGKDDRGGESSGSRSWFSRSRGSDRSRGDDDRSGRARSSDEKKTYRALTPLERLPRGLPDWFARNDKNEDGQIAMAEFSASWSDSKVEEFAEYDLDRDGVITSDEYFKSKKKPDKR